MKKEIIKGYKAMNKDMTCRGFKFEVGETYEEKEKPNCCNNGFHFCKNPLDTLNYYNLCDSTFTEINALGDINERNDNEDTKVATNKIKINAKLDLKAFIKASFDFLWEQCKVKKSKKDKDTIIDDGHSSQVATSGDYSQVATSGDYSQVATSGHSSQVATSGHSSQVATSGYYSKVAIEGKYSIGANIGINGQAKGIKDTWLVLAEYDRNNEGYLYPINVKCVQVDGETIKENTYYILKNGEFTEVGNEI